MISPTVGHIYIHNPLKAWGSRLAEERARTIERVKGGGEVQGNSVFLRIKFQWHI